MDSREERVASYLTKNRHLIRLYPKIVARGILSLLDNYDIEESEYRHEMAMEEASRNKPE